jgi:hypothetical protein
MRQLSVTFRKWWMSAFALLGATGMTGFFVAAALLHFNSSAFFGAVIISAFDYFFWLLGWHSKVQIDRAGIVVDNLLVRHVIPWGELSEIGVGNGLFFRLRDGRLIGSIMYGGSVIGALLRYRYTRQVAARMRAARDELLAGTSELPPSDGYVQRIGFSPWPPLLILALMEAIASLSLLR